jgi:hypothetical protein
MFNLVPACIDFCFFSPKIFVPLILEFYYNYFLFLVMFDLVPLSLENYFYNFVVPQCSLCSFLFPIGIKKYLFPSYSFFVLYYMIVCSLI